MSDTNSTTGLSPVPQHHKIDYVEFASPDLAIACAFFGAVFGWRFTEYGADYIAFHGAGLEGGLYRADRPDQVNRFEKSGSIIVFYSRDLEASQRLIQQHGGKVVKPIFSFPGGRRFHFMEPTGTELAIWSDS